MREFFESKELCEAEIKRKIGGLQG